MAGQTQHQLGLQALQWPPVELITKILSKLDSIKQLQVTISSHRVFLNAFINNHQAVKRNILKEQILDDLMPYALALHVSTQEFEVQSGVDSFTETLHTAISDPASIKRSLDSLSMSEAFTMSEAHKAVQVLTGDFALTAVPELNETFKVKRSTQLSEAEEFRLGRAFYRFQIMCNLICIPEEPDNKFSEARVAERYFDAFSPWVNEQLYCVYWFMLLKLCAGWSLKDDANVMLNMSM
jgi:hypothetical protein